ncbi:MAG: hypothetical protein ACRCVA_22285 [Phreatobacter sp.]
MISRIILGLVAGLVVFSNGPVRAADEVGVPECDRFITSYETCVTTRAPAEQRSVLTQQIAQMRTQWKALAANPQTRTQLQQACTMQAEQMKQAMAPMGCTF